MNEVVCKSCGSNDLYEENGYRICRYCGTRFLITKEDKPLAESNISLNEDVQRLLERWDADPSQANKYAQLILQIDPSNQRALNQLHSKPASGGCYIATAVYGSYDCPQVWTLRRFRDMTLAESWYGRLFIRTYYALSPHLVKWFGDKPWFQRLWKTRLDTFVGKLQQKGFDDTPYQDKY